MYGEIARLSSRVHGGVSACHVASWRLLIDAAAQSVRDNVADGWMEGGLTVG